MVKRFKEFYKTFGDSDSTHKQLLDAFESDLENVSITLLLL